MAKKKRKQNRPKRLQFNRKQRLASVRQWMSAFEEPHDSRGMTRSYRKRYAVDLPTSFLELELIGFEVEPEYKRNALASYRGEIEVRKKKRELKARAADELSGVDQDDTFAYIVGYTSGGAAYGLTWKE